MKILTICSTIDLKHNFATTLYWWQLFKGLYENGNELIVIPYMGYSVETLWWRTYPNPCALESLTYNFIADKYRIRSSNKKGIASCLVDKYVKPKWERHLFKILEREKNIDAVVFMIVPLNHLNGLPTKIRKEFHIPVLFYDGDLPTSLPEYIDTKANKFNIYPNADLSEYDVFMSNALCSLETLKKMGASVVKPLLYGVDTDVCCPIELKKDIDVFYSGIRSAQKEQQMEYMIGEPSKILPYRFMVGGMDDEKVNLGNAQRMGIVPTSEWRSYVCRSKVALNITKIFNANSYGASSMRPFELAAMGSCVVSDPNKGLNEWFDVGKEIFVAHDSKEAIELYKYLLDDEYLRQEVGKLARNRVIKDHSTRVRAKNLVEYIIEAKKSYNS